MFPPSDQLPRSALFVCPAVTPWNTTLAGVGANNPGIRLFKYRRDNVMLLDWEQYYLDLSRVPDTDDTEPVWELAYRASEAYGLSDLSAQSMHELVESFEPDDSATFDAYYLHNSVDYDNSKCAGVCKQAHMCAITKVAKSSYTACLESGTEGLKSRFAAILVGLLFCAFYVRL